jgi:hypothetical protein
MSMSEQAIFTEIPPDILPGDASLMAAVFDKLASVYPGHPWAVMAARERGIVDVQLLYLVDAERTSGRYGYTLFTRTLDGDPGMACVVRAGGELLERFRLSREKAADGESRMRALENGLDTDR